MSNNDELYTVQDNQDNSIPDELDGNVLSELKGIISKKVKRKEIFITVPERPGVQLLISPNITQQQIKAWQKNCGSESKNGIDATKFACTVIGHTTMGIWLNGEEAYENCKSLGFASPSILEMTNTKKSIPDAIQAFFGLDPHLESAALAIIDAAGYGDNVESTENPSIRS